MPTYREGIEKGKNIDEINKQFDKEVNPNKFFDFFREWAKWEILKPVNT